jgi:hypothetical protein
VNIDGKKIGETERVAAAVTVAFCFRVFGEKRLSEFASVGRFFFPGQAREWQIIVQSLFS